MFYQFQTGGKIPAGEDKAGVVSAICGLVEAGLGSEDSLPEVSHSALLEAFWAEAYKEEDIQGE